MQDLKVKLIKNETEEEFITSDHPVVVQNQLYIDKSTGIGTEGLQIFLPLNPYLMVVAYDSYAYRFGCPIKDIFNLSDPKTLQMLNKLQWVNTSTKVYFHSENKIHRPYDLDVLRKQYDGVGRIYSNYLKEFKHRTAPLKRKIPSRSPTIDAISACMGARTIECNDWTWSMIYQLTLFVPIFKRKSWRLFRKGKLESFRRPY